jgi:hypothetical protein
VDTVQSPTPQVNGQGRGKLIVDKQLH